MFETAIQSLLRTFNSVCIDGDHTERCIRLQNGDKRNMYFFVIVSLWQLNNSLCFDEKNTKFNLKCNHKQQNFEASLELRGAHAS